MFYYSLLYYGVLIGIFLMLTVGWLPGYLIFNITGNYFPWRSIDYNIIILTIINTTTTTTTAYYYYRSI
jgi:hypothetical protein